MWLNRLRLLFVLGIGVTLAGGCKSEGPVVIECGGGAGFVCPPGLFCDLGATCGGFDKIGRCAVQPTTCEPADQPVCGCDGETYLAPCYAHASGASIAYEGPCIEKKNAARSRKRKMKFPSTGAEIDGSNVESAGDIAQEQWSPPE